MTEMIDTFPRAHFGASLKVSNDQLENTVSQARRFGNVQFKNHPQLTAIKGAVQVLDPKQLLAVLTKASIALPGNGVTTPIQAKDVPQLMVPSGTGAGATAGDDNQLSPLARETELLGKVMQLLSESTEQKMMLRLQILAATFKAAGTQYDELANTIEANGEQWANDSDALQAAQGQASGLQDEIDQAQSALDAAQNTLSDLEGQAAGQDPVPAELQQQIDEASNAVDAAQAKVTVTTTNYNNYVATTLNPAVKAEGASRAALEDTQKQSEALIISLSPQQLSSLEAQRKQNDRECKSLTMLMAVMSQLLNRSANDRLQATVELKAKISQASIEHAKEEAIKFEEETRKAENVQKTMGCIGKILGWLIAAVSFVGAVFTGGASLALAAVGLALTVADEIDQAVTGHSFLQAALQPIMSEIVEPLMKAFSTIFTHMLEAFGVDKATAEMVGQILGAIAASATLVVGMIVVSGAMGKLVGAVMKKIGKEVAEETSERITKNVMQELEEEVVENVTKNSLKNVTKSITHSIKEIFERIDQGLRRTFKADEIKMAKITNRSQRAVTVGTTLNTAIGTTQAIIVSDANLKKSEAVNEINLEELAQEVAEKILKEVESAQERISKTMASILTEATNAEKISFGKKKEMILNISA